MLLNLIIIIMRPNNEVCEHTNKFPYIYTIFQTIKRWYIKLRLNITVTRTAGSRYKSNYYETNVGKN